MATPLGQGTQSLSPFVKEVVTKARTTWLKNDEVLKLLLHHTAYELPIGKEAPRSPGGGLLFLFNRKAVRFFRKDGHEWRKKADGKTVRETHEKLKIGNKEVLNCYYAHSEAQEALQRRCYWLLEGSGDIVLVHYLSQNPTLRAAAHSGRNALDNLADRSQQSGLDLLRQSSTLYCINSNMDRASSTPVPSNACPGLCMSSARSLDRQSSLGPLHAAPSFSAGTVQTGSTFEGPLMPGMTSLLLSSPHAGIEDSHSTRPPTPESPITQIGIHVKGQDGCRQSPNRVGGNSGPAHSSGCALDLQKVRSEQDMHIRAWEALKRKEREKAETPTNNTLQPAASLTRVDSDTLKVAPSLSGATGGFRAEVDLQTLDSGVTSRAQAGSRLQACLASPFLAASHQSQPIPAKLHSLVDMVPRRPGSLGPTHPTYAHHCQDPGLLASSLPGCDFEPMDTGRIKRYRSGDITGSNHSLAQHVDLADFASPLFDDTSSVLLQPAPGIEASRHPGLPRKGLARSAAAETFALHPATGAWDSWQQEERGVHCPPRDSTARWASYQSTGTMQADKLVQELDMLLPLDLDWAMNLSNTDHDGLRHC